MYTDYAMKINKSLKKEIHKLINTKEININVADMLLFLYSFPLVAKDFIEKKEDKKQIICNALLSHLDVIANY